MDLLAQLSFHRQSRGTQPAVLASDRTLTYEELDLYSGRLAAWILQTWGHQDPTPLVVYGHKSAWMLVCFLACAKAGRAYCPVDCSMPQSRLQGILQAVSPPAVLCTQLPPEPLDGMVPPQQIQAVATSP